MPINELYERTLNCIIDSPFQSNFFFFQIAVLLAIFSLASGDLIRQGRRGRNGRRLRQRQGRQEDAAEVQGGVDFSGCVDDPETGLCCVEKEETIKTLQKDPILECTHKNVEKCHYTYVTQFSPTQEEVCEENFEKTCQITFKQQAVNETVQKCYKPLEKVCNGQGPEECRTVYESSCTTRYVEKQPGEIFSNLPFENFKEMCSMALSIYNSHL